MTRTTLQLVALCLLASMVFASREVRSQGWQGGGGYGSGDSSSFGIARSQGGWGSSLGRPGGYGGNSAWGGSFGSSRRSAGDGSSSGNGWASTGMSNSYRSNGGWGGNSGWDSGSNGWDNGASSRSNCW